jgi:hypothetical protein
MAIIAPYPAKVFKLLPDSVMRERWQSPRERSTGPHPAGCRDGVPDHPFSQKRPGAYPEDAAMIGDTPYVLAAAQRAELALVSVRSGGYGDATLCGAVATSQRTTRPARATSERVAPVVGAGSPTLSLRMTASPSSSQARSRRCCSHTEGVPGEHVAEIDAMARKGRVAPTADDTT